MADRVSCRFWCSLLILVLQRLSSVLSVVTDGCVDLGPSNGYYYYKPEFNKCYLFVEMERSWPAASSYCRERGGHLMTVNSEEIQSYAVERIEAIPNFNKNGYWIGGHDREGEGDYMWDSGAEWGYTNWAPNEPDNSCPIFCSGTDCVQIRTTENYQWTDYPCDNIFYTYYFICEFDPLPTTTATTTPATTTTTTTATTTTTTPATTTTTTVSTTTTTPTTTTTTTPTTTTTATPTTATPTTNTPTTTTTSTVSTTKTATPTITPVTTATTRVAQTTTSAKSTTSPTTVGTSPFITATLTSSSSQQTTQKTTKQTQITDYPSATPTTENTSKSESTAKVPVTAATTKDDQVVSDISRIGSLQQASTNTGLIVGCVVLSIMVVGLVGLILYAYFGWASRVGAGDQPPVNYENPLYGEGRVQLSDNRHREMDA